MKLWNVLPNVFDRCLYVRNLSREGHTALVRAKMNSMDT